MTIYVMFRTAWLLFSDVKKCKYLDGRWQVPIKVMQVDTIHDLSTRLPPSFKASEPVFCLLLMFLKQSYILDHG